MKIVFPLLGLLAVLGIAYALAFFGVIPVQKMAAKSPGVAHALVTFHLAKALKPVPAARTRTAVISPEQEALNAEKKQLADQKAALTKEQADFEAQKQTASATPTTQTTAAPAPAQNSAGKLDAIYAAMSADDLLTIFAKLPDQDVIRALTNLDEKKAGKVLAGLPPTRAARLTQKMTHTEPKLQASL